MDTFFINGLTNDQIIHDELPLGEILKDSLYYPACGSDGGVIKYCNTKGRDENINSFVYCDYSIEDEEVCHKVESEIRGYHVYAHRSVSEVEVNSIFSKVNGYLIDVFLKNENRIHKYVKPFCHWFILERDTCFDDNHGPHRISLLYVGADGVLSYDALYNAHNEVPRGVAIIQPGHGFGNNWTDFTNESDVFACVMKQNPVKMPEYIFYGGIWSIESSWDYTDFEWSYYKQISVINDYYCPGEGRVVIYKYDKEDRVVFDNLQNRDYCVELIKKTKFSEDFRQCVERILYSMEETRCNYFSLSAISGKHRSGKSHLLALLSLIAEDRSYVDYIGDETTRRMFMDIAGLYAVIRIDSSTQENLKCIIDNAINEAKNKKVLLFFDGLDQYLNKRDYDLGDFITLQGIIYRDDIRLFFSLDYGMMALLEQNKANLTRFGKILDKCNRYCLFV